MMVLKVSSTLVSQGDSVSAEAIAEFNYADFLIRGEYG